MDQYSPKRFRTNPIEFVIFAIISLVFMNSVYTLFYEHTGFNPAALSPMAANPISEGNPSQSLSPTLTAQVETRCEASREQTLAAPKVRLSGSLCHEPLVLARSPASADRKTPVVTKTHIFNSANKFAATVFPDDATSKYTTDYIPLEMGKNPIRIEFSYSDGKSFAQDYVVTRAQ